MPSTCFKRALETIGAEPSPNPNDFYSDYVVNCNCVSELPDLTFTLNHREYVVKGHHYTEKINGLCYLLLYPIDFYDNSWILGDPFIKPYFTVFDLSVPRRPILRFCRSINP